MQAIMYWAVSQSPPEKSNSYIALLCARGCKLRRPTNNKCCGKNHWKAQCFWTFELESIEKDSVFKPFILKSMKNIVLFNLLSWNHWKVLCFWTFEFETIENHCVFKHLSLKSLKSIVCFKHLSLKSLKSIVFLNIWAWTHWKA